MAVLDGEDVLLRVQELKDLFDKAGDPAASRDRNYLDMTVAIPVPGSLMTARGRAVREQRITVRLFVGTMIDSEGRTVCVWVYNGMIIP